MPLMVESMKLINRILSQFKDQKQAIANNHSTITLNMILLPINYIWHFYGFIFLPHCTPWHHLIEHHFNTTEILEFLQQLYGDFYHKLKNSQVICSFCIQKHTHGRMHSCKAIYVITFLQLFVQPNSNPNPNYNIPNPNLISIHILPINLRRHTKM